MYPLNEGTFDLYSEGGYLKGTFRPLGAQAKYIHRIPAIRFTEQYSLIGLNIGAATYSQKSLPVDDIKFRSGFDACIETTSGYLS